MNTRAKFRQMLKSGETIVAPSAFDPLAAMVIERLGFNAVYMGGWMMGSHFAVTEALITLTQQANLAKTISQHINIPIIIDGHECWGEGPLVAHTIRELEAAGVAAVHIEDVASKVQYYEVGLGSGGYDVTSLPAFKEKIKIALNARTDPDFVIIGRTDAASCKGGTLDEAIRRAHAMLELGVEVLMPILRGRGALVRFRQEVPQGILLALSGFDGLSIKQLEELGYKVVIFPATSTVATVASLTDIYTQLKNKGIIDYDMDRFREVWAGINELTYRALKT